MMDALSSGIYDIYFDNHFVCVGNILCDDTSNPVVIQSFHEKKLHFDNI